MSKKEKNWGKSEVERWFSRELKPIFESFEEETGRKWSKSRRIWKISRRVLLKSRRILEWNRAEKWVIRSVFSSFPACDGGFVPSERDNIRTFVVFCSVFQPRNISCNIKINNVLVWIFNDLTPSKLVNFRRTCIRFEIWEFWRGLFDILTIPTTCQPSYWIPNLALISFGMASLCTRI